MFFDLTYNVKEQIITTLRLAFSLNKNYRKIHITDRFPQELKKLPAIVIKNASYPMERAGVDDYIKYVETTTGDIRVADKRGTSIKNVRIQKNHLLYCVFQPEIFRIDVLEDNLITVTQFRVNKSSQALPIAPGTKTVELIRDVEIEFDSVLVPGDFLTMLLTPIGGAVEKLYGGLVEMEMSLIVMAETTTELEEVADLTMAYLWALKKTDLEREQNILIKTMRHTGEAEIPEYKSNIFTAGIDISLRSQWTWKVPIDQHITQIEQIEHGEIATCDGIPLSIID